MPVTQVHKDLFCILKCIWVLCFAVDPEAAACPVHLLTKMDRDCYFTNAGAFQLLQFQIRIWNASQSLMRGGGLPRFKV